MRVSITPGSHRFENTRSQATDLGKSDKGRHPANTEEKGRVSVLIVNEIRTIVSEINSRLMRANGHYQVRP